MEVRHLDFVGLEHLGDLVLLGGSVDRGFRGLGQQDYRALAELSTLAGMMIAINSQGFARGPGSTQEFCGREGHLVS